MPELPSTPVSSTNDTELTKQRKSGPRLTRRMRAAATEKLEELRMSLYRAAGEQAALLPSYIFLPSPVIQSILDRLALLRSSTDLDSLIKGRIYLLPYRDQLWDTITEVNVMVNLMREEDKQKRRDKAKETRAQKAAEKAAAQSTAVLDPTCEDEDEDGSSSDEYSNEESDEVSNGEDEPEVHRAFVWTLSSSGITSRQALRAISPPVATSSHVSSLAEVSSPPSKRTRSSSFTFTGKENLHFKRPRY